MPKLLPRPSRPAQEPLEIYLHEINDTPLLNANEEKELAYLIEDGDLEARDHMVRANLRLVVNIARRYIASGLGLQDLIAEGNMGLMRAAEAFDASMDVRFATYASYWIKQSIKRAVINGGKTIRLPAYTVELLNKWRRSTARLREELGRAATQEEIAAQLKLSKRQFHIVKMALRVQSAGAQEVDEPSGHDALTAGHGNPPDAAMSFSDDLGKVMDLLTKMDSREAAVLRLRFGLSGDAPKTLREVGSRLGLTRERVRQIERGALDALRDSLTKP
jgi:RNA polymerase primary sigma factor